MYRHEQEELCLKKDILSAKKSRVFSAVLPFPCCFPSRQQSHQSLSRPRMGLPKGCLKGKGQSQKGPKKDPAKAPVPACSPEIDRMREEAGRETLTKLFLKPALLEHSGTG